MPTVAFSLDYLRRLSSTPPELLASQAFDYGLDATLQASTLEVEVTAERPDLLAAEGFTRALNIYNGQQRTVPGVLEDSGLKVLVSPQVLPLRPFIAALVVEDFATLTSLRVSVQVDTVENFASPTTVLETEAVLASELTVGYVFALDSLPLTTDQRYVRLNYSVTGTAATAGRITAGVTAGNQTNP